MDKVNLLGLIAGALTTVAFLPQVIKTWRSRSARDVSWLMFGILAIGIALWVVYGLLIRSAPVALANGITLFLVCIMLALKRRYASARAKEGPAPDARESR
jgi:MtN3 and saliva related transmembrane protein